MRRSFIWDDRGRLMEEGRMDRPHQLTPAPPSGTSMRAHETAVLRKTNYKAPGPPRGCSVTVSTHKWALTRRGLHQDCQMGDPAGSWYRFELSGSGCRGGNWNFRWSSVNLMFYLHWGVCFHRPWPEFSQRAFLGYLLSVAQDLFVS